MAEKSTSRAKAQAAFERGREYFDKGDCDRAVREYTAAIRFDPGFAAAWSGRGGAHNAMERHEEAIRDCCEAVRLDPRNADRYFERGMAYADGGRYDEAIRDFDESMRLDSGNIAAVCLFRGDACSARGDYEGAVVDYTKALGLVPGIDMDIDPEDRHAIIVGAFVSRADALSALKRFGEAMDDYTDGGGQARSRQQARPLRPRGHFPRAGGLRPRHSRLHGGARHRPKVRRRLQPPGHRLRLQGPV